MKLSKVLSVMLAKGMKEDQNNGQAAKPGDERQAEWRSTPIEIQALRLSSDGSGVGRDETGMTTFVPGLLPGETGLVTIAERKKRWQRGELKKILKSCPERVTPPCPVFASCGGCQLQHLAYQETLKWKRIWVEDALQRIGKLNLDEITVHPTIGMDVPWRYRNKARLHMDAQGRLGYYREKTNDTVVFPDCLLLSKRMNRWIKSAEKNLCRQEVFGDIQTKIVDYEFTWRENTRGEGILVVQSLQGKEKPFILFDPEGSRRLPKDYPANYLLEEIMGLRFLVSPLAFLQVNPKQTEVLYAKALEYAALTGNETVWDLYCGVGTITLLLARHAREVVGVEENPYAVSDAEKNAALNGLRNVRFVQGKTEEKLKSLLGCGAVKPDVIVLDPPRAGVDPKGLEQIIHVAPQRIVYVSCDPATLARDLGRLAIAGYRIHEVQPVDMFPWTSHVETVVSLSPKRT